MNTHGKPLHDLTAGDLMKRPVVTIPQELTLRAAAGLLQRERISGAPVIDHQGRCVGVLSATDFLRRAGGEPSVARPMPTEECFSDWQVVDVETLPTEEVRFHMSSDVVTAPAEMPIAELSRMM